MTKAANDIEKVLKTFYLSLAHTQTRTHTHTHKHTHTHVHTIYNVQTNPIFPNAKK